MLVDSSLSLWNGIIPILQSPSYQLVLWYEAVDSLRYARWAKVKVALVTDAAMIVIIPRQRAAFITVYSSTAVNGRKLLRNFFNTRRQSSGFHLVRKAL